jgi:predicted nucleotidyltransferase
MLADLMERIETVNRAEYMYRVRAAVLFGSYLRGGERIGDLDVAVQLEAKWKNHDQWKRWREQRMDLVAGRTFRNITAEICWQEREVWQHLKARKPRLSLHTLDDFLSMRKRATFCYRVILGDPDEIETALGADAV